ncbi:hypothetical protein NPIL_388231 [Nephila pilipes]|uniref:Uncharacterized protein n=1 Tax=Nephila pilipes TaxID=299642 RepID=A0A8X6UCF1_NEPPI|nr:hypothetical protein NPIL_388231 [Nephila pilipes]
MQASNRSPFSSIKPISQRLIGCRRAGACDNATFTLQGRPLILPLSAPGHWPFPFPTSFWAMVVRHGFTVRLKDRNEEIVQQYSNC